MLGDGIGALIAERVELTDQRFALDPLPFGDPPGELADAEWRQQRVATRRSRSRPEAAACRCWPEARSTSPTARPSRARPARRGRRAGSPSRAGSGPPPRARTTARFRQARASPLRRRRSRPRGRLCWSRARRGRDRRQATAGSPSERWRGSAAGRREGRAGAVRSSGDPDIVELRSASIIGPSKRSGGVAVP